MVVKLSQLSLPLATLIFIGTADLKIIKGTLQPFVKETVKVLGLAAWTWITPGFDLLYAHLTEAVSTAGGLVGLP